jgi:hypothetical protein
MKRGTNQPDVARDGLSKREPAHESGYISQAERMPSAAKIDEEHYR